VKCWGNNKYGQVGDGTTTHRSTPVDVVGMTGGVDAIAAGGAGHICAVTSSKGIKCCGRNEFGEVGDGTFTLRITPVDVSGITSGAIAVATGGNHTCALMQVRSVKCWGRNEYGEVGDGTLVDRPSPVEVIDPAAPTTTISPTPGSPDGHNGSYASSVHLDESAVDDDGGSGVVETRCVVDPASAPSTFEDLPSGCPLSGGGKDISDPGPHVAYAASVDAAGNEELPVSFPFRIGHALSVTLDETVGGSRVISSRGPIDCPTACAADLSEGDVTLTASPGPGLVFAGWSGDCVGNSDCVLPMIQNSSVSARFVPPDASAPTTSIVLSPASPDGHDGSYASSLHVTVSASDEPGGSGVAATRCVLDPGSRPASFSDIPPGCDLMGAGADVSRAGSHVVYAASKDAVGNEETPVSSSFRIGHTLSVTVNDAPSGGSSVKSSLGQIDCPGTCSAEVPETAVTLTPVAGSGRVFTGWSGDCSGTGACSVSMIQNRSVSASFSAAPPPPPTNLVGNPGFEAGTTGWIPGGAKVTLTRVSGGHSGAWAGQLTNSGSRTVTCTINDSPDWVRNASVGTYTASMWVRSSQVGATFTLRIRESSGSKVLRTKTVSAVINGSWQQLSMTYAPKSVGSSLDLNGYMAGSRGPCFTADDASITKA
jgi:hypothetical protein